MATRNYRYWAKRLAKKFSPYTPPATSIANKLTSSSKKTSLPKEYQEWHHHYCHLLVQEIKHRIETTETDANWQQYHKYLYKLDIPTQFKTKEGVRFTGIIQKVNHLGQIEILNQAINSLQTYAFKEVALLYDK